MAQSKRVSKKQQLSDAYTKAVSDYVGIQPEVKVAIENEVSDIVSTMSYELEEAIRTIQGEALDRVNDLASKHGRGIVRIELAENDFKLEFDNPVQFASELVANEADWQDVLTDYRQVSLWVAKDVKRQVKHTSDEYESGTNPLDDSTDQYGEPQGTPIRIPTFEMGSGKEICGTCGAPWVDGKCSKGFINHK